MKIFVEGLIIPSTNEWWIDETWTAGNLVEDVVKIVTEKKGDCTEYYLVINEKTIEPNTVLIDIINDGDTVIIKKR